MTERERVTSRANSRVKRVVALQQRKQREAEGLYVVEGPHQVDEALLDGVVTEVFATERLIERYADAEAVVTEVADHVMEKLATSRTPQGVVAVARRNTAALADVAGRGFLVVCHEVADPGNAGTIIRTADAFGAAGVVFTAGSVDPWNPKCVRAATGSLTHLPIVVEVGLEDVSAECRRVGQQLVALAATGATDLEDPGVLDPPVALVFGSEAHGLPPGADVDEVVAITRYGRAESLNLAAAVAVACYATARRVHETRQRAGGSSFPSGRRDPR